MTSLTLVIANTATSGKSLAAWLLLRQAGAPFAQEEIQPGKMESELRLRQLAPVGPPPILLVDGIPLWGLLPIAEFVADHRQDFWPEDPAMKAQARSFAYELASAFGETRIFLPLDARHRYGPPGRVLPAVERELVRLAQVCGWFRKRHGAEGPFLFGTFGVVDALAAALVVALDGHQAIPSEPGFVAYAHHLLTLPALAEWRQGFEPGEPTVEQPSSGSPEWAAAPPLIGAPQAETPTHISLPQSPPPEPAAQMRVRPSPSRTKAIPPPLPEPNEALEPTLLPEKPMEKGQLKRLRI